jgi:flagellar biosynthesis GTPase FlhF
MDFSKIKQTHFFNPFTYTYRDQDGTQHKESLIDNRVIKTAIVGAAILFAVPTLGLSLGLLYSSTYALKQRKITRLQTNPLISKPPSQISNQTQEQPAIQQQTPRTSTPRTPDPTSAPTPSSPAVLDSSPSAQVEPQQATAPQAHPYPAYLDELKEQGYLHLYDHLMKIRDLTLQQKQEEIKKMTPSEISHVVTEVREAIISKVSTAIPPHKKALFLLGESGGGKSTTFCFLRGDSMVLQRNRYVSQKAPSGIIGHELDTSCTLLPQIEKAKDYFIVDFPGFDDTNGPIVSLGIECALKALIHDLRPKILLIESITNLGNRGQTAGKLGDRLSRILANSQDCLLGITKYSQDPDFLVLRNQEGMRIEAFKKLEQKEKKLLAEISDPEISPKKKSKRDKKLEKVRLKKGQVTDSPDSPLRKKRIEEKEELLLDRTKVRSFVPLYDLEDPNRVNEVLNTLMKQGPVRVNSQHHLDPNDRKLLKELFTTKLMHELETKENPSFDAQAFRDFEDNVFDWSLIRALCSKSNPEMGEFLHLPEIDPSLVDELDRDIISTCITKYMECVISTLNLSAMDEAVAKFSEGADTEKMAFFQNKLEQLKKYIMLLMGRLPEDEKKAEGEWIRLEKDYRLKNADVSWRKVQNYLSYLLPGSSS